MTKKCTICGKSLSDGMHSPCSRPCRNAYKLKKKNHRKELIDKRNKRNGGRHKKKNKCIKRSQLEQRPIKVVHCDGSSNQFESLACIRYNDEIMFIEYPPKQSSYTMEERALKLAIEVFKSNENVERVALKIISDSKAVVVKYKHALRKNNMINVAWRSREKNYAGIYLEDRLNAIKNDMFEIFNLQFHSKQLTLKV